MTATEPLVDPHDVGSVVRATGVLAAFNRARVLAAADVHVARTLGRLCGETDEDVLLAAALAVRAPRLGHVCVDLPSVRNTITVDSDTPVDLDALPWPEEGWTARVRASELVDAGGGGGPRPLRLREGLLYLDRYWTYERQVLDQLRTRAGADAGEIDRDRLREGLDRLFPWLPDGERPDRQRLAAAAAVLRRFTVIAGGPGTGKTTTVAKVLSLLAQQWPGDGLPRVALAAPTGKAADRVEKSVHGSVADLAVSDEVKEWLLGLQASTVHRLLGRHPGSDTRFRHDRRSPVPFDVVVVDETSMVSLALMAKLLDALADRTRLVLLGDPEQLASVEAGAVLGDIVGPASADLRMSEANRSDLAVVTGEEVPGAAVPESPIGDAIVVLRRVHRFGEESGIARLANRIQAGDADGVEAILEEGRDDVVWIPTLGDADGRAGEDLAPVRAAVVAAGRQVLAAATAGDGAAALAALGSLRILCAHRRGPFGVATWVPAVEQWLARAVEGFSAAGPWYHGQPILVTENDYQLNLFNGDVGVVVDGGAGHPAVAFQGPAEVRLISPLRLEAYETVHAMTVHKSQGSQFDAVAVVLPEPDSPALTRELLYTAVTRAQRHLTVVGSSAAVTAAVNRRIQRASGLRAALWPPA